MTLQWMTPWLGAHYSLPPRCMTLQYETSCVSSILHMFCLGTSSLCLYGLPMAGFGFNCFGFVWAIVSVTSSCVSWRDYFYGTQTFPNCNIFAGSKLYVASCLIWSRRILLCSIRSIPTSVILLQMKCELMSILLSTKYEWKSS